MMLNKVKKIIAFMCCIGMLNTVVNSQMLSPVDYYNRMLKVSEDYNTEYKPAVELALNSKVMKIGNEEIQMDTAPIIIDDRAYLPVRAITEALGASVDYLPDTRQIIIHNSSVTSTMTVGSDVMSISYGDYKVEAEVITLTSVPVIDENNRCLLPVRHVAEDILGCNVTWDNGDIVIERTYQSKRFIVKGKKEDIGLENLNPSECFCDSKFIFVLQFSLDTPDIVIKKYSDIINEMPDVEYAMPDALVEVEL